MTLTALVILAVAAGVVAVLVGLLRLAKAAGDRLVAGGPDEPVSARGPLASRTGYVTPEEQWEGEANSQFAHDLDALTRVIGRSLDAMFEEALSALHLDPADRSWARLASGEYPLVGVA
jgi:hypothetical protein